MASLFSKASRKSLLFHLVGTVVVIVAVVKLYFYVLYRPERTLNALQTPSGFEVRLFAAEPMLVNPVAFSIDEFNRIFVVETNCFENRKLIYTDDELASRSSEEGEALRLRMLGTRPHPTGKSERVRMIADRSGRGTADTAVTVVDDFPLSDGLAAGVLARRGKLWLGIAPKLWLLSVDAAGKPLARDVLHHGFGLRRQYPGHDLHGLIFGPDGKLYFTMGDRGLNVRTSEGRTLLATDCGTVLRCNPNGTQLEIFATGLRNPQRLAFDQFGNLFTIDNDSNRGDRSRLVYVVEGGDSGWRIGFQEPAWPDTWLDERVWDPQTAAPFRVPPVGWLASCPAGLVYYPGTGLPREYDDRFFLCDVGKPLLTFSVRPKGAGFDLGEVNNFIGPFRATDLGFGTDGSLYVSDFVDAEQMLHLGRLFRIRHGEAAAQPIVAETAQLLAEGMDQRSPGDLLGLLGHVDARVRQAAQFALAEREEVGALTTGLETARPQLARIHALWGLGQAAERRPESLALVALRLDDADPEVRVQAARILGDHRHAAAYPALAARLQDPQPRVRSFAALALGKIGRKEAVGPLLDMLRRNADSDQFLRHAGVMGLTGCAEAATLSALAHDPAPAVRLAALLALRRLERPEVAAFLADAEPLLVLEAVRAIHDVPIEAALPALADLARQRPVPDKAATRIINANFRMGTVPAAAVLAALAADPKVAEPTRIAALAALADWQSRTKRDRVLGLWRPLPDREARDAADALQPVLGWILKQSSGPVATAATQAAACLHLPPPTEELLDFFRNRTIDARLRAEALAAVAGDPGGALPAAVATALASPDEPLRRQGVRLIARAGLPDALARLKPLAADGPIQLRQAAVAALGELGTPGAHAALAALLDSAAADGAPPALRLDLLEAAAASKDPTVQQAADRLRARRPAGEPLAAWWETLEGGDADAGRKIYLTNQTAACVRCHKLRDVGGDIGPALDGIGSKQPRRYLLESLLLPNAQIAKGFDQTTLHLHSGAVAIGRIEAEADGEVRLVQADGQRARYKAVDIATRSVAPTAMPDGLGKLLSPREIRDLVEFLAGLRD